MSEEEKQLPPNPYPVISGYRYDIACDDWEVSTVIDAASYRAYELAQLDMLKAGYLPVEPVQLEVLSPEGIEEKLENSWDGLDQLSLVQFVQDFTLAYNEAKGQLYRVQPE